MIDELDFTNEKRYLFERQGNLIKRNFERRNIKCTLLDSKEEVYDFLKIYINDLIANEKIEKIAFSDGVTLYQLGLFDWVRENYNFMDINQPLQRGSGGHYSVYGDQPPGRMNLPYDEWKKKTDLWYENCRKSLLSDLLIISCNAITMDGCICSIDGLGNRVAGMIFGPKHVLCLVGRNKISPSVDLAMERIHNYVVPMTYIRHITKHSASFDDVPCVKTGKCHDCSHEYSSCRDVVVIRGQIKQHSNRIHLVVINEDLGF